MLRSLCEAVTVLGCSDRYRLARGLWWQRDHRDSPHPPPRQFQRSNSWPSRQPMKETRAASSSPFLVVTYQFPRREAQPLPTLSINRKYTSWSDEEKWLSYTFDKRKAGANGDDKSSHPHWPLNLHKLAERRRTLALPRACSMKGIQQRTNKPKRTRAKWFELMFPQTQSSRLLIQISLWSCIRRLSRHQRFQAYKSGTCEIDRTFT